MATGKLSKITGHRHTFTHVKLKSNCFSFEFASRLGSYIRYASLFYTCCDIWAGIYSSRNYALWEEAIELALRSKD